MEPMPLSPRAAIALPLLLFALFTALALRTPRQPQVLVYGATPQGVTAAVAAARRGLRVTLVTPETRVGGVLSSSWLATLDDTRDARGRSLYGGLYAAFFRAAGSNRSLDVGVAGRALSVLLRGAGVDLRADTQVTSLERRGDRITALRLRHRLGGRTLSAPTVIDASDTAELAARLGLPFTLGRADGGLDRRQMAATLVFRLRGVAWRDVWRAAALEHTTLHDGAAADGRGAYGFGPLGDRYRPSDPSRFKLRGLNLARQRDGSLLVNALLIAGVDGTDPAQVARAYILGTLEVRRVVAFLRVAAPAVFGRARLAGVAPQLYLRETRHLLGRTRLHADDVLLGAAAPDQVALGGYALDGQLYRAGEGAYLLGQPRPYGVPLSALLAPRLSNLLVVSQAASFDSAAAFSARAVPLQMALGEAAGTAAWVADRRHQPVADVARDARSLRDLRSALLAQGARLGPDPDDAAPRENGPDAAVRALLRRGLFNGPYYLRGTLGLGAPISAGDFVADLEHWLAAHGRLDARREALRSLHAWVRANPAQPLSWAGARAIFMWLGEDAWEVARKPALLSRGWAARLLTDMMPAAERRAPGVQDGISSGPSPGCAQ